MAGIETSPLTRMALSLYRKLDFDFDRAGTVNPQISSDANIPHGSSTDGHSDILSDYDDLASQQTSPDLSTASPLTDRQAAAIAAAAQPAETPTKSFRLPMFAPKPLPPQLKLDKVNTSPPQKPLQSPIESATAKVNKPLPKSPSQGSSVIANIFNWGNTSPSATEFSSIPSPSTPGHTASSTKTLQPADPSTKSNVANNPLGYCESYLSTPPPHANAASVQLEEMEDELKAISSELASSIRREIDLEDLVDRLQEQVNNPQAPGKRTSDYFSDSGYSSAKLSDYDQSREEIEKIQRRSEQEKASLRLELTNKLQDERSKRKALDQQVRELQDRASQMDLAEMNNMDANGRLKELENTCEDLRRKLGDERQSKINFEDLLSALKNELNDAANERDNLRDEVVPQLRARVEGLEAEAASYANLTYESTKMQHQLQSLQQENSTLRSSTAGMDDILARSMPRPAIPGRNDSTKNLQSESREALAERLKDVEAQRDALHNALKNLLERQEFQNRENQKKIKILEKERSRLLGENPKKAGFERDITKLRTEVNTLRRRAEDALEQKWQVEKGLGGLKMDLDRAEEEITTLRGLLKEKDILMPQAGEPATGVTSESLQKAYDDLQAQYNESIERIKQLEVSTNDEGTRMALQRLEKSLNAALSAKDGLPATTDGLQSEYDNMSPGSAQRPLADELSESANRVELLASHVRSQLATNAELRQRLSDAISRGESQSKANSGRIAELQERLRGLEDELVTAQSSSEDRIGRHEEEITRLKEAHNEQLRRLHQGGSVGMTGPRKSPILNSAAGSVFARAENMASKSVEDETQVKKLRERVSELERALSDTENEMQEVVGKMNSAQIEVMTLQEERETAIRETKRLQALVKQEASSPFASSLRMFGMAA